jgi:hypothetical protein
LDLQTLPQVRDNSIWGIAFQIWSQGTPAPGEMLEQLPEQRPQQLPKQLPEPQPFYKT